MKTIWKDDQASGNNDIMIVLIVLILAATWATWLFLFANSSTSAYSPSPLNIPGQNYTAPDSSGFMGQIGKLESLSLNNPEIAFVNGIVFIPFGFIIVFIALRFFRGAG